MAKRLQSVVVIMNNKDTCKTSYTEHKRKLQEDTNKYLALLKKYKSI